MIQEYPDCKNYEELTKYERHHFEILCATLNSCVPSRTDKEYKQDNKAHYAEYKKNFTKIIKSKYVSTLDNIITKIKNTSKIESMFGNTNRLKYLHI